MDAGLCDGRCVGVDLGRVRALSGFPQGLAVELSACAGAPAIPRVDTLAGAEKLIATFVEKISDAESDTVLNEAARWKGDGCSPTSSFDNCKEEVSKILAEAGLQLRSWATDADGSCDTGQMVALSGKDHQCLCTGSLMFGMPHRVLLLSGSDFGPASSRHQAWLECDGRRQELGRAYIKGIKATHDLQICTGLLFAVDGVALAALQKLSCEGTVLVEEWSHTWRTRFETIAARLSQALSHIHHRIEHVGSTSVEGLAAKPIIDIDIVITDDAETLEETVVSLASLGYQSRGDRGIEGRYAFEYLAGDDGGGARNLYVCVEGTVSLANHMQVRNYLRKSPEAVVEYSGLKRSLAKQFPNDIDSYVDGKTDFIISILSKSSSFDTEALESIALANKYVSPPKREDLIAKYRNSASRVCVTQVQDGKKTEMEAYCFK